MLKIIPVPTQRQRRLVDIGILLQFYAAAVGHLVVWLWVFYSLSQRPPHQEGQPYDETRFVMEIFVFPGIPISFGVLVCVYIVFRLLLAYAEFPTALMMMIALNIFHSLLMCQTVFVPARLLIPTILYAVALYFYLGQSAPKAPPVEVDHDS